MNIEVNPGSGLPAEVAGAAGRSAPARQPESPGSDQAAEPVAGSQSTVAEVKAAAEQANRALRAHNVSLQFRVDETTERVVVSVVDEQTGRVVRQIPSEEQLAIAAHLETLLGTLFSETA